MEFHDPFNPRTVWDGSPRIQVPQEYADQLVRNFIPHWHVLAVGPPPYGQLEPVELTIDDLIVPTWQEALARLEAYVLDCCALWGIEYDQERWLLHRPVMCGPRN